MNNNKKVLLVDDEVMLLDSLGDILSIDKNIKVFKASNGEEALEYMGKEKFDLVICDLNMPQLNGIDVLETLRTMGFEVPFIFYTAYVTPDLEDISAGFNVKAIINKMDIEVLEQKALEILA